MAQNIYIVQNLTAVKDILWFFLKQERFIGDTKNNFGDAEMRFRQLPKNLIEKIFLIDFYDEKKVLGF